VWSALKEPSAGFTVVLQGEPLAMTTDFLTDVQTLRANARKEIDLGSVTDAYGADRERVIEVLNEALATELVSALRYKRHYFTAHGLNAPQVEAEFLEHATQEQQHADSLAARIVQLGGEPDFNPDTLTKRSHVEYDASPKLLDMVREDLVAERVAIASYTEIATWLGDSDITTRRLVEDILGVEEEHADDLLSFLEGRNG
jgi:bacterioferritin